ncbi:MAG: acyl-ACP--UDP-N-acetylglucosamine O-acyltransferase [Gammaproteobacteria bacterium]|nr:acyl-ACP--UDP-N-acetylglucosamine O-acyltransferase [Gammaproteobacteria bacterium]MCW8840693.1 acyl-ACP--UDP-N-acetylglucosamine O-acyltransferase [Gammaproteobacteria bacterium]MCW8959058.1 acyl-ACP--UDP-N-acetylglucosamine O-acyltransferase [Gammaproteobacteria bacterium]MCW8973149.1 acyl-ACP--UDP-N-acetylglucosamine O-acyltransferase [Gammaproteobacteria bacterium]MCW8991897.1 acyl-ACP--UDP-N-acetylglucosamine O-acyltransferase [Gammaproteobacteria bacterium]
MSGIHPTAIINSGAKIGEGVTVGPYSVIGADVEIGANSWIGPHVVVNGPTRIGCDNRIFQFASVGEIPQDLKYHGEPTRLEIGDRNTIREFVTINRGTVSGGGLTRIGDDNLLMAYIHIAHDCHIGNHVIFSNNASLAGHAVVGDHVILSGFTLVHQFCSIGDHAFTGMGSAVSKDVPPYLLVSGSPATPHGINKVGLKRRGFSDEQLRNLTNAYKILYRQGLGLEEAKAKLSEMANDHEELECFADFLQRSTRSIIR